MGACTKVGFEGDILGEWELDVFGKEVLMTVTEQGFVTFEAIFDNPDFALLMEHLSFRYGRRRDLLQGFCLYSAWKYK